MIKLKSLYMKNFRRFIEETIRFPDGIVGISGPNGAGKTTVFEAIGYALYGAQPSLTRTGKEDMKRSTAPDNDSWGVELEFTIDVDTYKIIRTTAGMASGFRKDMRMLKNNLIFAKDDAGIKAKITEMLKMDFTAFSSSVFCQQSEISSLGGLTPGERKKLMLKMLKISGIDVAIAKLRQDKKDAEVRLKTIDEMLGKNVKAEMEKTIKDLEMNVNTQSKKIDELKKTKEDTEINIKKLVDERNHLLKTRTEMTKKAKELDEQRLFTERKRVLAKDIEDLKKQIDDVKFEDVNTKITTKQNELIQNDASIMQSIAMTKEKMRDAIIKMNGLSTIGSECPTCGQHIPKEHMNQFSEHLKKEIGMWRCDIDAMFVEHHEINEELCLIMKENEKQTANERKQVFLSGLRFSLSNKEKEMMACNTNNFDEAEQRNIHLQIDDIDKDITSNDNLTRSHQQTMNKIMKDQMDTETVKASASARLDEIGKQMVKMKENEARLQELVETVKTYGMTDEAMSSFRIYLIDRVRPMLAVFTSDLVSQMTKGRYNKVDLNDDYDILMYDHGIPYPLSRFSGGERDIVNLSLRLALSQMIAVQSGTQGLGFIILDEIFGSADNERRETILSTLANIQTVYAQIICITHIESVVAMFPNIIPVVIDGNMSKVG